MRYSVLPALSACLLLAAPAAVRAGDAIPPEVLSAAQTGLSVFFKESPSRELLRLGFENQAQVDGAVLGEGYRVFTVRPAALLAPVSQTLQNAVAPTNQWQFLVLAGGGAKALLTVDLVDGAWTPVAIGAAGLASELSSALAAWPRSAAFQHRLIRVYQAQADFIELSQAGRELGILPMTSALMKLQSGRPTFSPSELLNSNDVLSSLRTVVERNLQLEP